MSESLQTQLRDLEARFEALNRARVAAFDQLTELEAQNERLKERVAVLEQLVAPDPESIPYETLSRSQKIHRIRKHLVEDAVKQQTGKSRMEYKAVKWLFDGHPSPGHCYDLMELAGELEGFTYETSDSRSNRVLVDLDAVNDETLIHAANNALGGRRV
ncbi:hypothetical protein [Haloprofundus marisrubri]|uniref:hypothetical protein n=1 Tax=Haloprofundus marisrubri TaxID=1514971 RepID=UPI0012BAE6D0|nr:hypothetical protein [Haloprofundus marisrubri]